MDTEVRFFLKRVVPCVVLVLIGIILFAVTKRIEVEAGHEVVLVDKPFWTFLDSGGVRQEPLTTGSKWLFYTTEQIPYDVRPVQHTEKFDAATDGTITSDNIPIAFNAYIKVRPITGQTPALHDGFGPGWYDQNLKEVFRTAVRDEVAKATMTALTTRQTTGGKGDVLGEIQRVVSGKMRQFVTANHIPIEVMEVIVGKATPPETILVALSETAAQQQRAKTEDERAAAELRRSTAEQNRAAADNAYRNSIGYDPSQFLTLELAKKQVEAVKVCGEKAGCTIIIGTLGGATPAVTLKQ